MHGLVFDILLNNTNIFYENVIIYLMNCLVQKICENNFLWMPIVKNGRDINFVIKVKLYLV